MSSTVRTQHASKQFTQKRIVTPAADQFDPIAWNPLDFIEDEVWEEAAEISHMWDLGSEVRREVLRYSPEVNPLPKSKLFGEEVGDDRIDISDDLPRLACALVVQQEVLMMKTSINDTFISKELWNFCEVSNSIPTTKEESYHHCRKTGKFQNLGYTDVPPLRIILDVSKGDMSHSSTTPGKATMLGGRMRTPRAEHLQDWFLASYLQDGLLRTSRSTEPKYLPQIMGGSGVRAPFGVEENLYLAVHAYRGGEYQRLYGTASQELQECLRRLERDEAFMPILCQRLRDKQEYLHGTYAEKVFVPTKSFMDRESGSLPPPFLKMTSGANDFVAHENRLLRTRNLVTRTEAVREWEFTTRVREQLLSHLDVSYTDSEIRLSKARGRVKFGGALRSNSAFANLLSRNATLKDVRALTNENFIVVNTGVTQFSQYDSKFLFYGGRSERYSIEDLTITEDLFLRNEVSEEETFKVGGIPLNPIRGGKYRPERTRIKVGLYQINETMEEWAADLLDRLLQHRGPDGSVPIDEARAEFHRNPEWVNDDTGLVAQCLTLTRNLSAKISCVVLVSDDHRLGNQMSNTCNVTVLRISSIDYLEWMAEELGILDPNIVPSIYTLEPAINRRGRADPVRAIFADTGSIAAASARTELILDRGRQKLVKRDVVETGIREGKRYTHYTLTQGSVSVGLKTVVHVPTLKAKKFLFHGKGKYLTGQGRSLRSEESWRSGGSGIQPAPTV